MERRDFLCDICGGVFHDRDAVAKSLTLTGYDGDHSYADICDACALAIIKKINALKPHNGDND